MIQISNILFNSLPDSYTCVTLKLLCAFCDKVDIKKREPIMFSKKELLGLLGRKKVVLDQIEKNLDLLEAPLSIRLSNRKTLNISLFEKNIMRVDSKGEVFFLFTSTKEAEFLFYDLDRSGSGYISGNLSTIVSLNSKFDIFLYFLVMRNVFGNEFEFVKSVSGLMGTLRYCRENMSYGKFNDKVLKKSTKRVIESSKLHFEYTYIKRDNTVLIFGENGGEKVIRRRHSSWETHTDNGCSKVNQECSYDIEEYEKHSIFDSED